MPCRLTTCITALTLLSCSQQERGSASATGAGGSAAGTGSGGSSVSGRAGANATTADGSDGSDGSDAASAPPFPGAEPCRWPGWYVSPWDNGCKDICLPDDIEQRVPALRWVPAEEMCSGCRKLDVSEWYPFSGGGGALTGFIEAAGAPDVVTLELRYDREKGQWSNMTVTFAPEGEVLHARRTSITESSCSRAYGPNFAPDGTAALHFRLWSGPDLASTTQKTQVLPQSRLNELAITTDGTFDWGREARGVNDFEVSSKVLAFDYSGSQVIGYMGNGQVVEFEKLAAAPPGDYPESDSFGDVVFVKKLSIPADAPMYSEWFSYEDGQLVHLLGGPDSDILALGTDGKHIIWSRGRDPSGVGLFETRWTYDLYVSPFATKPEDLQPRLLYRDLPQGWTSLRVANGWVVSSPHRVVPPDQPTQTEVFLMRIADGKAYNMDLPDNWNFGFTVYPGVDELWAPATPTAATGDVQTVLRIPYSSMTVLQEQGPTP